jgi:demethylmenaquinone methyltransferase/2-methoxy-6-polyprenyl-1,4-benzoquinol methylase
MKKDFTAVYKNSWNRYDFVAHLIQAGRDYKHRHRAFKLAGLKEGDTVLDLCCGTGLSFGPTQQIIGNKGKIIAVDINHKMLDLATKRANKNGWSNITFINADIEKLAIDDPIDMAIFAMCWYDKDVCTNWVRHISKFIKKDSGKMCFLDFKLPENWVRLIAIPILWCVIKLLNEAFTLEELQWDAKGEIGYLLHDPTYHVYYLDSIITISGKPKQLTG